MKIVCTQENLKNGLQTAGRIISSSNTLPILNNLLIKTENGSMKIFSTNLEVAVVTQVRCKVEEEGGVTVANKTILELVGNMPNKNITLQNQNSELKIDTDNYHTKIKTLPTEEFPLIPTVDNGESLSIDPQELKTAIEQVVFAASTNQTQPEISGVLFSINENKLKIVATDRYRLAEKTIPLKTPTTTSRDIIIPQKTAHELAKIIGNQNTAVDLVFNETQASMNSGDTLIISRLVDGQYPDYRQIIPTNFNTTAITEKQALINALRAAGVFSQSTNSVKLKLSPQTQQLVITTEAAELGDSVVELPAVVEGEEGEIIFNFRYVLDCLAAMPGEKVIIKTINDSSPVLVVPEKNNDYLYLVMPIKS